MIPTNTTSTQSLQRGRGGFQLLRDLLGGGLVLAIWLALWTLTWAAVAGPLEPAAGAGAGRPVPAATST